MGNEIWKDIIGFEERYQVSNLGRIKSKSHTWISGNGRVQSKMDTIKVQGKNNCGYSQISLRKNGKAHVFSVHRVVAYHFVKNEKKYKTVNHINGDKSDNRAENLEWCTQSENVKHAYRIGLSAKPKGMLGKKGVDCLNSKKVICYFSGKIFPSVNDAAISIGMNKGTLIAKLIGSNNNTTTLRYLDDFLTKTKPNHYPWKIRNRK